MTVNLQSDLLAAYIVHNIVVESNKNMMIFKQPDVQGAIK